MGRKLLVTILAIGWWQELPTLQASELELEAAGEDQEGYSSLVRALFQNFRIGIPTPFIEQPKDAEPALVRDFFPISLVVESRKRQRLNFYDLDVMCRCLGDSMEIGTAQKVYLSFGNKRWSLILGGEERVYLPGQPNMSSLSIGVDFRRGDKIIFRSGNPSVVIPSGRGWPKGELGRACNSALRARIAGLGGEGSRTDEEEAPTRPRRQERGIQTEDSAGTPPGVGISTLIDLGQDSDSDPVTAPRTPEELNTSGTAEEISQQAARLGKLTASMAHTRKAASRQFDSFFEMVTTGAGGFSLDGASGSDRRKDYIELTPGSPLSSAALRRKVDGREHSGERPAAPRRGGGSQSMAAEKASTKEPRSMTSPRPDPSVPVSEPIQLAPHRQIEELFQHRDARMRAIADELGGATFQELRDRLDSIEFHPIPREAQGDDFVEQYEVPVLIMNGVVQEALNRANELAQEEGQDPEVAVFISRLEPIRRIMVVAAENAGAITRYMLQRQNGIQQGKIDRPDRRIMVGNVRRAYDTKEEISALMDGVGSLGIR
ncbi:MAG: hypothetical protein LBI20_00780 [Holosporales bacterium]|jgi:hypothetical protein|nr:hypothetical protein [Holosporales bacterium]